MGTDVDNSTFILYTEFHPFPNFLSDTCVFMARLHNMPCRIHPCLSILISQKEIVSVTRKVEKHESSCTISYGELRPQLAVPAFEYRPLEIARF